MPTRQFWTQRHPVCLSASYVVDLARPEEPPTFGAYIYDQSTELMASKRIALPLTALDDSVVDAWTAAWGCYLYGEPEELRRTLVATQRKWWDYHDREMERRSS